MSQPSVSLPFGARLRSAVAARGPLCVGIDPHPRLLAEWNLPDTAGGLERFARGVLEALGDRVAVVKPQSAFFERHGSAGVAVLEGVLADARAAGALTILDVKRGDIGSTVAAYASAYLDPASPLAADAITASPYLGLGSLRPLVDTALEHSRGVFVLALTSNPEGAEVQRALGPDGRTVAQQILDGVGAINAAAPEARSVGVVVGATLGDTSHDLTRVGGPLLAPGIGAQGGTPAGLAAVFGPVLSAVLPSVSRAVLAAGPGATGLRAAAELVLADLQRVLGC